ncbi:hypothetical protein ScPMuIL_003694 [Solemya velum]
MSSAWSLLFVALVVCCDGVQERVRLPFVPIPPPGAHIDPEVYMNASELITSKDYPCERRFVHTVDGYILEVQRIPHGKNEATHNGTKPVVFLQHGLLSSAASYLENLANESLPFILADAGMDVWLGNSRGNKYSRKHTHLNPDHDAFWEWSWDRWEMAELDIPATVDYILKETGQDQLYYIGHSQGGAIGLAAFSGDQQLAGKIKMFFALAPAAFIGHMKSPLKLLTPFAGSIEFLWELFGHGEFFQQSVLSDWFATEVCDAGLGNLLCENLMFLLNGFDSKETNAQRERAYGASCPGEMHLISVKIVANFWQFCEEQEIPKFDFGRQTRNMRHYNQVTF